MPDETMRDEEATDRVLWLAKEMQWADVGGGEAPAPYLVDGAWQDATSGTRRHYLALAARFVKRFDAAAPGAALRAPSRPAQGEAPVVEMCAKAVDEMCEDLPAKGTREWDHALMRNLILHSAARKIRALATHPVPATVTEAMVDAGVQAVEDCEEDLELDTRVIVRAILTATLGGAR